MTQGMTRSPGVTALLEEHAGLEARLADPDVHADQALARSLGRRYAALAPVVATVEELRGAEADLADARELAREDPAFAAEATELEAQVGTLRDRLSEQLVPRDAADANDVVVEVKSGEGGEESALFAGDLLRMYSRYAERRGWKVEVLSATESDLGGYKDVTVAVTAPGNEPEGVWAWFKYEGGVHRVQRVPVTESQGRIHTSAAGVLVYPEVDAAADVEIDEKDLRVDVFRSSGKGGQGVNTTDSAVRITHLPTGVVVSCQNERSQLQNKARAMDVLRSRLQAIADEAEAAQASADRRSQVRTVDRSERVRTYNYPENRISDHRVGYKSHDLDRVLDGDLDAVLDALRAADRAERMAQSGPSADEPRS
ncbi:peptide chain release factor 1 [Actinomycetospora sp. NBC_00405]|uniref:peptide chain release factor 1 n=1 Tax=Actinomycetospora sp. NBC_00405 TaxID=2975952 RepID=UPI002E210B24